MTYDQALQYLESFVDYEKLSNYAYTKAFGLSRIKRLLGLLGNPQESLRHIHVAGTKGKGSTCAFIAHILREAGYKVGLYTSPHLSDFRERIRILKPRAKCHKPQAEFEGMISKRELADLVEKAKPIIEKFSKRDKHSLAGYAPPTFFEAYTALAFLYFKAESVDFVVLETGLGGRLDATNVVNPLACVITPVSLEHTQFLGDTLREIAAEKAGIIKKGAPVITAPQKEEALDVIRNRCREVGARLYEVKKYNDLKIKLLGRHQLINAAVAVQTVNALNMYNIKLNEKPIKKGLFNTSWPGRCEVISRNPLVVLDGAQNAASCRALKEAVRRNFKYKRLVLILGISNDKDIRGICKELHNFSDEIILTRANNPRASNPEELAGFFAGKKTYITGSIKEAKQKARLIAKKKDLILVTGSLFVAGEYRS